MCDCIKEVNEKLKERNTRLAMAFCFSEPHERLMISSEVAEKKRGARATVVFPTFCPFCGEQLPETKDRAAIAAATGSALAPEA